MYLKYVLFFSLISGVMFLESLQGQCNAKLLPNPDTNNLSCNFQNQSSGGMLWYFWDFGDGFFITDTIKQNQLHYYSNPGIYKVTLTVQDTAPIACIDSYSEYVILVGNTSPLCYAHFEYTVSGNMVSFTNQSLGTYHILSWSFGDGSFGNNTGTFTHTFPKEGYFPVTLSIMDTVSQQSSSETQQIYIPITSGCAAAFNILNIDTLTHTVAFNSIIEGNYTDVLWDFGDGAVSTSLYPVHRFKNPGVYPVKLVVYNSADNTYGIFEEQIKVNISQLINKAYFNFIPDISHSGKLYFTNNSINTSQVQCLWNFGDGHYSTECNPVHQFATPGIYNVALTIFNAELMQRNTINKKIGTADNELCKADFIYLLPENQPAHTVKFIENSPASINEQMWNFGDNSGVSYLSQPLHQYDNSGFYPVSHKVNNVNNEQYLIQWVNVNSEDSLLKVNFEYFINNNDAKTTATTGYKSAVSREVSKLHWNFGNGTFDTTTLEPLCQYTDTGTYQVCLTVWEYNRPDSVVFCKTVSISSLNVKDNSKDGLSFFIYPNPVLDNYFIVQLNEHLSDIQFRLLDALGRAVPVEFKAISLNQYAVLIKNKIQKGVYYIQLQHSSGSENAKLLIQY